jgi:hypothetical protein
MKVLFAPDFESFDLSLMSTAFIAQILTKTFVNG